MSKQTRDLLTDLRCRFMYCKGTLTGFAASVPRTVVKYDGGEHVACNYDITNAQAVIDDGIAAINAALAAATGESDNDG